MEIFEVVDACDLKSDTYSVTCVVATLSDARRTGAVLGGVRSCFGDEGPLSYLKRVKAVTADPKTSALPEVLVSTAEDFAKLAPKCWAAAQKECLLSASQGLFSLDEAASGSSVSLKAEEWVAKSLACGDVIHFRVVALIGRGAAAQRLLSREETSCPSLLSGSIEEWPLDVVKLAASLPAGLSLPRSSGAKGGAPGGSSASSKGKAAATSSLSLRDALDGVRPNPREIFSPPLPPSAVGGRIAEPSDAAYIDTMLQLLQRLEADAQAAGFRPQACVIACRASDWVRSIESVLCRAATADSDEAEDDADRLTLAHNTSPAATDRGAAATGAGVAAAGGTAVAAAVGGSGSASAASDAAPAPAITEKQRSLILSAVPTAGPYAGIVVRGFAYGRGGPAAPSDASPSASGSATGAGASVAAPARREPCELVPSELASAASARRSGGLACHPMHSAVLLAAASAAAADRAARSSSAGAAAVDDGSHPPPHKRARTSTSEAEVGEAVTPLGSTAAGSGSSSEAAGSASVIPLPVTSTHPSAYLCTGADAFLSEEPNFMDAMALVHCRIARVFFRRTKPSVEDQGCLLSGPIRFHTLPGLNHRYRVFHLRSADDDGRPLSHERVEPKAE